MEQKLSEGFRLDNPKYGPQNICKIMQSCWHENPEKRPSFYNIKADLEVFYNLKDMRKQDKDAKDASNKSGTQLKYAHLLLQEQKLKAQFRNINQCNSR